jgi:hypothetical protein
MQASPLEQLSVISKSHRKKGVRRQLHFFCAILAAHPRALEQGLLVNMFGAAARYRRAAAGSTDDDARPDNSTQHTGKI